MSDELGGGLRELAADAGTTHAAGPGFPTATMTLRARRNRRLRSTATVAAGAVTVTGVVLAGVAVAGLRDDRTDIANQWDVDYSACGLSLDELGWRSQPEGPAILGATSSGDGDEADRGARSDADGNLTVATVLAFSATDARLTLVASRPDFVVQSAEGVVVGVLGTPAGQEPDDALVEPYEPLHVTTAPMYSCAAADGRTTLGAGRYVLAASQRAVFADPDGTELEYLAQWQQQLEVPSATPSEGQDVAFPACGTRLDGYSATPGTAAVVTQLSPPLPVGSGLVVPYTLVALGDGPTPDDRGTAAVLLAQDGVVVGGGGQAMSPFAPVRCTDDVLTDEVLPPGEYAVWLSGSVNGSVSGSDEGGWLDGPWPLTITDSRDVAPLAFPTCGARLPERAEANEAPFVVSAEVPTALDDAKATEFSVTVQKAADPAVASVRGHHLGSSLLLVQDGTVVTNVTMDSQLTSIDLGGEPVTVGGLALLDDLSCLDAVPAGTYRAVAVLQLVVLEEVGADGTVTRVPPAERLQWVAAPPVEVTVRSGPTLAELPADVPLVVERLLRSAMDDDGTWRVTVEFDDRDGYARAREALVDAGYTVDAEESSADRLFWSYGAFSTPQYAVTLDVSNETGGGFLGDYVITAR